MTLWSMAIIALVLGGFGVACLVIVPKALMDSVDRDLEASASFTTREILESFQKPRVTFVEDGSVQSGGKRVLGLPLGNMPPVGIRDVKTLIVNENPGKVIEGLPIKTVVGQEMNSLGDVVLKNMEAKGRLDRGEKTLAEVKLDGKRFRVLTLPISGPDSSKLFVFTAYPVEELHALVGTLKGLFLLLLPIALGATFIGGLSLTRKVLRPVRDINDAASEAGAHDLTRRLPVTGNDEFSELAGTFNGMFDRLQSSFGELETSVEQQKRFVADASHELRTPLTVIRGSASWALQDGRTSSEIREALEDTNSAAARMDRLISNLLLLAQGDANKLNFEISEILVNDLFKAVARQNLAQPESPRIEVVVQPPDLTVLADRDKMLQVLGNLVENALRHTPSSGSVRLIGRPLDGGIEIQVCDTGSGIPKEHLPQVFDRFYRVDDSRSAEAGGTGLGLALCQELVLAHSGSISIESQVGIGTIVRVILPG
jgi:signal transduction histidine kinase